MRYTTPVMFPFGFLLNFIYIVDRIDALLHRYSSSGGMERIPELPKTKYVLTKGVTSHYYRKNTFQTVVNAS